MMNDALDLGPRALGERSMVVGGDDASQVEADGFGGPAWVEWDHEAPMTPHGQLAFFIPYLKTSRVFVAFVADRPSPYLSPNAPKKRDGSGTAMLSMLVGAKRYAHIAAIRASPAPARSSPPQAPPRS